MPSTRNTRITALLVTLLSLGGCKTLPSQSAKITPAAPATPVSLSALSEFLNQAAPGAVAVLPHSPWGPQSELNVVQRYFAASGRDCFKLRVSSAEGPARAAIACQQQNGEWTAARLLAQY